MLNVGGGRISLVCSIFSFSSSVSCISYFFRDAQRYYTGESFCPNSISKILSVTGTDGANMHCFFNSKEGTEVLFAEIKVYQCNVRKLWNNICSQEVLTVLSVA